MMANKWVQAGLTLGIAVGFFVSTFLSLVHPLAPIAGAAIAGALSMWIGGNARGTDGWGGPYSAPAPVSRAAVSTPSPEGRL